MRWRRTGDNRQAATPAPKAGEVTIATRGTGVLVTGDPRDVDLVVAEASGGSSSSVRVLEASAVAAGGLNLLLGSRFVQFSSASEQALNAFGSEKGVPGYFRAFVRGDDGRIARNLEWKRVSFGPEQALAMQQTATLLALRAAIKSVEEAVERVGADVTHLVALVEAERLGDALGDYRSLSALVRGLDEGPLSSTDWSTVASLGPAIRRDLDGLRAYVLKVVAKADGGWRPGERVGEAETLLSESRLRETFEILAISEHNYASWEQLRIANVRNTEPELLESTLESAQAAVEEQRLADQELIDQLRTMTKRLTIPVGNEGLAPRARRKLAEARSELGDIAFRFARQRQLEAGSLDVVEWPGAKESARFVASEVAERSSDFLAAARKRLRSGDHDDPEAGGGSSEAD